MNVIIATFNKTLKEFLREKSVLFWTIVWPIIWVFIDCFVFVSGAPKKVIPYIKGSITISMMTGVGISVVTASISGLFVPY